MLFVSDIFDITTYDYDLSMKFGKDIIEVMEVINNRKNFEYMKEDEENYKKFILVANLLDKYNWIEWGTSIRGCWFDKWCNPYIEGDCYDMEDKIEFDEDGKDITYDTSKINATYEWTNSNPDVIFKYKKTYWLSGGCAMHLKLKKGKYKISFYTPINKQNNWTYPKSDTKPFQWESNVFEYNTENPIKVIFLVPTANDNGFYNGGWYIDYKAPVYLKQQALPKRQE